ncbi:phosphoribosylamine--glycine ligase [Candidatus Microgenomates bacterium]|nr:MAG: phosphoribosylamine--glycine ligase [Candidatus Microgenomates bacterium]
MHLVTSEFDKGDVIRTERLVVTIPEAVITRKQFEEDTMLQQQLRSWSQQVQSELLPLEHQNVIHALSDLVSENIKMFHRNQPLIPDHHIETVRWTKQMAIKLFTKNTLVQKSQSSTFKKLMIRPKNLPAMKQYNNSTMRILIIGSGAREHAIGWKLRRSETKTQLFFAPGNGGTAQIGENVSIEVTDIKKLVSFAKQKKINLTIVGPEASLAEGVVDAFEKEGLKIFGPSKRASQLETSKVWATEFFQKYKIPYPTSYVFTTFVSAKKYISSLNWKKTAPVIKADGLASGKGVFLPDNKTEALKIISDLMDTKTLGNAGSSIVVQERLIGEEVSVLAFCDGKTVMPMIPVQDHKRIYDSDQGPNTGGMGVVGPVPWMTQKLQQEIMQTIFLPTLKGLVKENITFKGILYAGLLIVDEKPYLLEYNVRFGDPETQILLPLLQSDLLPILESCIDGTLSHEQVKFSDKKAVGVVLASQGYPQKVIDGETVLGLDAKNSDKLVFHAGTKFNNNAIISHGGRILTVVSHAQSFAEARKHVYNQIGEHGIHFAHMQYRGDIGKKYELHEKGVTPFRLEIFAKVPDARATVRLQTLRAQKFGSKITTLALADVYTVDKNLNESQKDKVRETLVNPIYQSAIRPNSVSPYARFDWVIETGFLPGVTDNVGATAREMIGDLRGVSFADQDSVYSSQLTFLSGNLSKTEVEHIAQSLINPLIQRVHVFSKEEYLQVNKPIFVPRVTVAQAQAVTSVNLDVSDDELETLGKKGIESSDGTRRGPLALDLDYLKTIRDYFRKQKRQPTDIELESLAQTWSEHCKHTIFRDPIDDTPDGLFKSYIKKATEEISKIRADDFCVSVFTDNSGAIRFDDTYAITHKVETHNTPSMLDPFGGAITGIIGVNRDTIGFGLGAKPIMNQYGFCFGNVDDEDTLYRDQALTQPVLSPKRIMDGVISGVNSGGNCSGIPTPLGFVYYDERYRGKPLVFCGTLGLIPIEKNNRSLVFKKACPGDYIVMIGGRVGLDGIHGATFSSEALTSGSPMSAVQIGDPITQKKLSDAIINEARDQDLFTSITDNGAGGLSCSVSEMAKESNGCLVDLEKVPLKYPGLAPWQIWISESQERMTLAVPKEKWTILKSLLISRGVEATRIGIYTNSGRCEVRFRGETILDIDLDFLHEGLPKRQLVTTTPYVAEKNFEPTEKSDFTQELLQLLSHANTGSFDFISQQYDHDVQGTSVLKPLVGRGQVNSSVSVIKPLLQSDRGVAVSQSLFPRLTEIDPYYTALISIEAAVRQCVVYGSDPDQIALLDNFCWCDGKNPERLGQLKRACEGCFDAAVALKTPFISGKDSMFNDFNGFAKNGKPITISVLPTLLITALGIVPDVRRGVSFDFKTPGDHIYLLGQSWEYLAGSEYAQIVQPDANTIPRIPDLGKLKFLLQKYHQALQQGYISASIAIERGGLSTALAKMAISGMLGFSVSVEKLLENVSAESVLFSETAGRILVTVEERFAEKFEQEMVGIPWVRLGNVTASPEMHIFGSQKQPLINSRLQQTLHAYKSTSALTKEQPETLRLLVQKPRALVIAGYGFNCESETSFGFETAGAESKIVHVNDLIAKKQKLSEFDIIAFPGGFSYGDDTGSGNAMALKIKNHLWDDLLEFVHKQKLVIGICNGFQVLVSLGLLPALGEQYGTRQAALLSNSSANYVARFTDVKVSNDSLWFEGIEELTLPIAHGEGRFFADAKTLQQLQEKNMIALRYTKGAFYRFSKKPVNPTGTLDNIAALTNETGTVLGMMPHPERALFFTQLPNWTVLKITYEQEGKPVPYFGPGLRIFQNAVSFVEQQKEQQSTNERIKITISKPQFLT